MLDRFRFVRPLLVLVPAALCFLAAQGTGIQLFFHLSYLLVALLLGSYLWAWINLRGLTLTRELATGRVQVGEQARERMTLTNRWPLPRLWVEVVDYSDMPQRRSGFVAFLPGGEERRWLARTTCTLRGRFVLGPATLVSGDPFGIVRLRRTLAGQSELLVYPRTTPLPEFVLPDSDLPGGRVARARTYQTTPNVAALREYAPGDSFSRIHWSSTARRDQLMVKEFDLDPTAEVYIVLDMQEQIQRRLAGARDETGQGRIRERRTHESTEEYAVQAAGSIARHLIERDRSVGLIAWGREREVLTPEREVRQMDKILSSLAVLRAHGGRPLAEVLAAERARFGRNCTLVIVTASVDERWTESVQQLRERGVRSAVVLVDPASFGGTLGSDTIRTRLAALRVPVYLYRQGMDLATALRVVVG